MHDESRDIGAEISGLKIHTILDVLLLKNIWIGYN